MPRSLHTGNASRSISRVHIEYSLCSALIGCTCAARRNVLLAASDMPRKRTLPAFTSSADARQALSVRAPEHRSARSRRADAQLGVGGIDEWAWRSPADERRQRARVARGARVGAAARRGAGPAETAAQPATRPGASPARLA